MSGSQIKWGNNLKECPDPEDSVVLKTISIPAKGTDWKQCRKKIELPPSECGGFCTEVWVSHPLSAQTGDSVAHVVRLAVVLVFQEAGMPQANQLEVQVLQCHQLLGKVKNSASPRNVSLCAERVRHWTQIQAKRSPVQPEMQEKLFLHSVSALLASLLVAG